MKNSDTTIVIDIFKAYALAFFFTIALGNILVELNNIFTSDILYTLGTTMIDLACPVIAITLGVFMQLSPVGIVSLFLVGAVTSSAGNAAALITFIIALIVGLIFKSLDRLNKGFSLILYPMVAISIGILGTKYGTHYIEAILGLIVNRLIAWNNAAAYASGFSALKQYVKIAVTSGIIFTSPIGMYGIVPMMQQSANTIAITANTLVAGGVGIMTFMLGIGAMSLPGNDPGISLGILIGTPAFQFGNIIRRPQILIPPIVSTIISTYLGCQLFNITGSYVVMKYGNCCLYGLVELYKLNGWSSILTVTATFILVPIAITLVVYILFLKLNLIKTEDLNVNL